MPTIARLIPASMALAFALTAAFPATAAMPSAQAAPVSQRTLYPAIDPAFSRPDARRMLSRATLRAYITARETMWHVNTFCFVQQSFESHNSDEKGESLLWMIWHEGAYLQKINVVKHGQRYRPDPDLDPVTEGQSLANAVGRINLKTGVVPTDEDVGTSTFLVSRPWVGHLFAQCKRVGTQVRVPALKPSVLRHGGNS